MSMANPPSPQKATTCRSGYNNCAPMACGRAFAIEPCRKEPIKRRPLVILR